MTAELTDEQLAAIREVVGAKTLAADRAALATAYANLVDAVRQLEVAVDD